MAKDGTMRGGARAGSGRKPKALSEKSAVGSASGLKTVSGRKKTSKTSGKKLSNIKLSENTENAQCPEIKGYMTEKQKCGEEILAAEVFEETWKWLKERGCDKAVSVQLVRNYAMAFRGGYNANISSPRKAFCQNIRLRGRKSPLRLS